MMAARHVAVPIPAGAACAHAPCRPLALLAEAASCLEALEDYGAAAEQHDLAALVADAAGLTKQRHVHAAAWARLRRAADAAGDAAA
jgi:hypothetical protein